MEIICTNCSYKEKTNKDFFVKLIGGVLPIGGFGAWVTYFLAGTGLALPIVVSMIIGGTGILLYKEKITKWICNKNYKCPTCGKCNWKF